MRWDVFCKVIDNHGDAGVCWRLSAQLARRGQTVRLWIDDPSMLAWMAPDGEHGVTVVRWDRQAAAQALPGDVVIEAFGCELDPAFVAAMAERQRDGTTAPVWINLEYLSAEPYVERCHGLPSPVQHGPGAGLLKRFFYPGFTAATGGLLREPELVQRQARFDRAGWLQSRAIDWSGERLVSLFCYEPAVLPELLARLARGPQPTRLLVTAGRATSAVSAALAAGGPATVPPGGALRVDYLPWLSQQDFDHLLWACDLNFVRGEDSLVRAIWAARPFVWQAYPQQDDAHHAKLDALLDRLAAPPPWRQWHLAWNGSARTGLPPLEPLLDPMPARQARDRLAAPPDLASRLLAFAGPPGEAGGGGPSSERAADAGPLAPGGLGMGPAGPRFETG